MKGRVLCPQSVTFELHGSQWQLMDAKQEAASAENVRVRNNYYSEPTPGRRSCQDAFNLGICLKLA